MIIAVYSKIKIDRILHYFLRATLISAAIVFLCMVFALISSSWQAEKEMVTCLPSARDKQGKKTIDLSSIGSGSLALRRGFFCPFAARLREEMMMVGQNTRPDFKEKEEFLVQLKTTGEQKKIEKGDLLYLEEIDGVLHFSLEPTEFWVRPSLVGNGDLLLDAEKENQKGQVLLSAGQNLGKKVGSLFWDKSPAVFVKQLKEAKFWGIDLLVQHYGGKEHRKIFEKQKLMIGDRVCFVAQGDRLAWTESVWNVLASDEKSEGKPLALVRAVSAKNIEIDVWDETGFQMVAVKLENSSAAKGGFGPECMPTAVRMRTASQVACTLGKRRLILKEGDWLIRIGTSWRKLKTPEEIDLCLQHKMRGELLIFDKIEKLQGKTVLHAHLFDEMRTQMQVLTIPILIEKKKIAGGK